MRRLPAIMLSALITCMGTGCITQYCLEDGWEQIDVWRCSAVLITVPLDVVLSPIELVVWLDMTYADQLADYYLKTPNWRSVYAKSVQELKTDFNAAMRNPRYFHRIDENGTFTPEYSALCDCLFVHYPRLQLNQAQAEFVAAKLYEQRDFSSDFYKIWRRKDVRDVNLRLRAAEFLSINHSSFNKSGAQIIIDHECISDEMLREIACSPAGDAMSDVALGVLKGRYEARHRNAKARKE